MDPEEDTDRKEEEEAFVEEEVEEDDDDDDDDFAPLVAPTHHQSHALSSWKEKQALGDGASQSKNPRRKKQRRWMERLRRLRHRRLGHYMENDDTSCMADICRLVGSLLLSSMFFGPWIYIHITRNSPSSSSTFFEEAPNPAKGALWPNDSACAKRLRVNFTDLYLRIQQTTNATEFCETQVPGELLRRCACKSPLIPKNNTQHARNWSGAFDRNKAMASTTQQRLDVAFYGDSITEHWLGTDVYLGNISRFDGVAAAFRQYFTNAGGSNLEGVPFGIGGDQSNELLYRIENGEMPSTLDSKVYWLLIGTNDLEWGGCSPETVLVGNLHLIQTLLDRSAKRHNAESAIVVVNGILPRGKEDLATSVVWEWIQWINARLECFANGMEGVEYFNASSYFLTTDVTNQTTTTTRVDPKMMDDYLHPTGAGSKRWAKGIADRLHQMG